MMELAIPGWAAAFALLAVLAVVLFGIAIRSGRWALWLAGYAAVLLALAVALVANHERDGRTGEASPAGPPAATQPSGTYGVLDAVDLRLGSDEVT
jgi:hypothetical protein